jgi:hypothetical protein
MIYDSRYTALNRKIADGLRQAEASALALLDYYQECYAASEVFSSHTLILQMNRSEVDMRNALQSDVPEIRLLAIQNLDERWNRNESVIAVVRNIAMSDSDIAVQILAVTKLPSFAGHLTDDATLFRSLAETALASDDVTLRHSIYLCLCKLSGIRDTYAFGIKYVAYPLIFDEDFVEGFLTE